MRRSAATFVVMSSLTAGAAFAQAPGSDAAGTPAGAGTGGEPPASKSAAPGAKGAASGAAASKMPNQYTPQEKAQARSTRRKDVTEQNKAGKLPKGGEM